MIQCHEMWYGTAKTRFLASIPLRTLLLLCYMTVSHMTLTWHFCGGPFLQKVDINLLVLLEPFWVWSPFSNIGNTGFGIQTSLNRTFQGFWPQVQNSYFVKHLSMVASDNILWEKQYVLFRQIFTPSEKLVYAHVYSIFEIPSNGNSFKQFFENSLKLNCKEGLESFTTNI